jgi:hypothetical protein
VTGRVVPKKPASDVRGLKARVKTGRTPVLESAERRKLLRPIPATTRRERALITTLTCSVAGTTC